MRTHRTVEISRVNPNTGTTEYLYRSPVPTGEFDSHDPDQADLVWVAEGDTPPSGLIRYEITEALVGTDGSSGQGQWGICYTCREEFPLSEMALINGRHYCFKYGDAEEAQS